jgi:uncharacterized protein (UPF0276 family)
MRPPPRVGVNLSPDAGFRAAALPLFESGLVDAVEWDLDDSWGFDDGDNPRTPWIEDVLDVYAEEDALYGHGVWFSVLSAVRDDRQRRWLERLARECGRRHYRHVTEHFGWSTAGDFTRNTMFPCPRTPEAVEIGIDSLHAISRAAGVPVGLENLAPALGRSDATEQGAFLADILTPPDAFLLLDVHNVWTQAVNLDLEPLTLLASYPLERVRELHVSGGGWAITRDRRVRTDSHDDAVPAPTAGLLAEALRMCPAVEVVILERRADTLTTEKARAAWRADFHAVKELVDAAF